MRERADAAASAASRSVPFSRADRASTAWASRRMPSAWITVSRGRPERRPSALRSASPAAGSGFGSKAYTAIWASSALSSRAASGATAAREPILESSMQASAFCCTGALDFKTPISWVSVCCAKPQGTATNKTDAKKTYTKFFMAVFPRRVRSATGRAWCASASGWRRDR